MNEIMMIFLAIMTLAMLLTLIVVSIDLYLRSKMIKGDWYMELCDKAIDYYCQKLPEYADKIGNACTALFKEPDDVEEEDEAE